MNSHATYQLLGLHLMLFGRSTTIFRVIHKKGIVKSDRTLWNDILLEQSGELPHLFSSAHISSLEPSFIVCWITFISVFTKSVSCLPPSYTGVLIITCYILDQIPFLADMHSCFMLNVFSVTIIQLFKLQQWGKHLYRDYRDLKDLQNLQ